MRLCVGMPRIPSAAKMHVWSPEKGIGGLGLSHVLDGLVKSACGSIRVSSAAPGERGVHGFCDLRRERVGDCPHGSDHMPVAKELHSGGQMDRFVRVAGAGGSRLAC